MPSFARYDAETETPPRAWGRPRHLFRSSRQSKKHPHVRGEDSASTNSGTRSRETPPRAWGRLHKAVRHRRHHGNTPTCVGKTLPLPLKCISETETPPRAWGRHLWQELIPLRQGNTPTCVGKTSGIAAAVRRQGKHPHVRGEDSPRTTKNSSPLETPPRAWGRLAENNEKFFSVGNTPTCVGKTVHRHLDRAIHQKHPHVRGEDRFYLFQAPRKPETPPRAWGRLSER
ncbi:Domain of uncharacterised function (DUF2825) [Klebsiella pneumoniae]|nr:Domain of uncharacterised function (DUF2825) [Klebsiella pneumoniae]